jgi:hypothetical protein
LPPPGSEYTLPGGSRLNAFSSKRSPYPNCHVPDTTVAIRSSRCEWAGFVVFGGTDRMIV